jgi:hypothetical protein
LQTSSGNRPGRILRRGLQAGLLFLILPFHSWADTPSTESPLPSASANTTNAVPSAASNGPTSDRNPLVWDALIKQTNPPAMGRMISFTFWVTNTSLQDAAILNTISSCDCTVAEMPAKPWVLKPGAGGALKVNLTTLGRFGLVTKQVGLETSHGPQLLTVRADIPLTPAPFNESGRARDRMTAQTDRQAVLQRTDCAACHALPTVGRMGESLFTKACAICHISDHRAEMVPDLATLKREMNADYWRAIVTLGKPGSLMPAFAKSEGGVLDAAQIESLVEYLLKAYPSKIADASAPIGTSSVRPAVP